MRDPSSLDDRYAVTTGLMCFRFKKTVRDEAKHSRLQRLVRREIARIIHNVRARLCLSLQTR